MSIPVEIIPRHVHLSQEHQDVLFGVGAVMTRRQTLSQAGQYAYTETVDVEGADGVITGVHVLGPCRAHTQVELTGLEAAAAGIAAPTRVSGDTAGSPGCKLIGPKGTVILDEGVIVPVGHVHATPADADSLHLKNGDIISVDVGGTVCDNLVVRVHPTFRLALHLNADVAARAWINGGDSAKLV